MPFNPADGLTLELGGALNKDCPVPAALVAMLDASAQCTSWWLFGTIMGDVRRTSSLNLVVRAKCSQEESLIQAKDATPQQIARRGR
jgi:hypothetical protein